MRRSRIRDVLQLSQRASSAPDFPGRQVPEIAGSQPESVTLPMRSAGAGNRMRDGVAHLSHLTVAAFANHELQTACVPRLPDTHAQLLHVRRLRALVRR